MIKKKEKKKRTERIKVSSMNMGKLIITHLTHTQIKYDEQNKIKTKQKQLMQTSNKADHWKASKLEGV